MPQLQPCVHLCYFAAAAYVPKPEPEAWNAIYSDLDLTTSKNFAGVPQIADLMVSSCLKGWVAVQELVGQHSQAPHVHAAAVRTPLHHLWRQVVQGAAQRHAAAAGKAATARVYIE